MLNIKTLSILALAGSAVALPQWGGWSGKYFGNGQYNGAPANNVAQPEADQGNVVTQYDVVTYYTTVTGDLNDGNFGGFKAAPTAAPAAYSPAPAAPSPQPAAASAAPVSSGSNDGSYMSIVSEWRSKLGLSALTESSQLQANALKTVQDGNGQMVHELNPGSFAQVLAPGDASDFEKVFVGGWLCERSDLPGLDGICATMSQGWAYNGETGHADILVSKAYSKIGCALADGIWGCDLA